MTCIVAVETPAGVVMGSDRMASGGGTGITLDYPKTFTNGPVLFGCCGSIRLRQLLQHSLIVPVDSLSWDLDRWVSHYLMAAIRSTFEEHGALFRRDNTDRGGSAIIAIRGRAYELQSDYSFVRTTTGEYAVGSGEDHAKGSLHATRGNRRDPEARIIGALEAAAEHVVTVAGPFDIVRQDA